MKKFLLINSILILNLVVFASTLAQLYTIHIHKQRFSLLESRYWELENQYYLTLAVSVLLLGVFVISYNKRRNEE